MSTRVVIHLYRQLLRESQKFSAYNFRMYAGRKVRDTFRQNKTITDATEISKQIKFAEDNLKLIRRQAIVGHLYSADKLVIER